MLNSWGTNSVLKVDSSLEQEEKGSVLSKETNVIDGIKSVLPDFVLDSYN